MIVKGYSIDCQNKERLLHEFVSEYGINLSHKDNIDVFSTAVKPRNCNNKLNIKKK
ncbi:MAG: hypothetical protein PHX04_04155 [Bacilli bacterium]|nr:hypothetical protein [Bacilli bacterium]